MDDELYIVQNGITVCVKPLPGSVRAFSMPCGDGYTVIVNDCLSPTEKQKALEHELGHIKNNDHYNREYVEYDD